MDALGRHIDSNVPLCNDDNTTIDDSCGDQSNVEADEYTGFTTRGHVEIVGNEVDVTGAHGYDPKVMERSIDLTGFADFWDGIVFSAAPCETEEETEEQIGRFKAVPVSDEFLIPEHSVVGSTHELRMPSNQDSFPLPAKVHHFPKTLSFADPSTYKTISYEQINYGANDDDDSDICPRRDSSDDSSYYDTVSSTSSTATLLRKVVAVKVDDDDVSDHDDADNTQEEFKFEYTRPEVPKIFIEKVESCHPEPEYAGLMQTSGTGQALLAQSLEQVPKSFEDLSPVFISSKQDLSSSSVPNTAKAEEEKHIARLSKTYLKNLVILSLGFMLCFTAFFSLRNLQSSINHEGGLGLISMSTIYAAFMGGCIFAPSIVNKMRPKFALVISMHGLLLFVVSNFYPQYYTLVPASAVLGFSLANLWTAQGTYLTSLAITYAALTNKDHDAILGLFNGFFLFLIQIAQILGNLISSSVFNIELENEELSHLAQGSTIETEPENGSLVYSMGITLNDTSAKVTQLLLTGSSPKSNNMCGVNYCHSYKIDHATEGAQIQPYMLYVLLGVFTAVTLSGILVLGVFLNKLDVIFRRSEVRVAKQLLAIFSLHRDRKLLALVPMLIFLGIEETFMFGEITKVGMLLHYIIIFLT